MKTFSHGDCIQHRKRKAEQQQVEDGEGYFHKLPKKESIALVEMARVSRIDMRKIDAADAAEHAAYVKAKRKSELEEELGKVIKQAAFAVTFFDRWQKRAVRSVTEMNAKLRSDFDEPVASKREQLKLNWLREQIQMRVLGFNWTEFRTSWSCGTDEEVGSFEQLRGHLMEILEEERDRDMNGELPVSACMYHAPEGVQASRYAHLAGHAADEPFRRAERGADPLPRRRRTPALARGWRDR